MNEMNDANVFEKIMLTMMHTPVNGGYSVGNKYHNPKVEYSDDESAGENVPSIRDLAKETLEITKDSIVTQQINWGLPFVLWGDVGYAKSAMVDSISFRHGFYPHLFQLSQKQPMDICMTMPVKLDNGDMVLRPIVHEDLENQVLFLDELSETDNAMQSLAMQLTLNRRVGKYTLHPTTIIICAANPSMIACGGKQLSRPVVNRLIHFMSQVLFPGKSFNKLWCEYQRSNKLSNKIEVVGNANEVRDWVLSQWDSVFRAEMEKLVCFVENDKRGDDSGTSVWLQEEEIKRWKPQSISDLAFATPRSVENAGRVMAAANIHGLTGRARRVILEGCVGKEFATSFLKFEKNYGTLPNFKNLLDGKENWVHDGSHPDRTRLVLRSCYSVCKHEDTNEMMKEKRIKKLWGLLSDTIEADKSIIDLVVPVVKDMMSTKKKNEWHLGKFESVSESVLLKANPVITATRSARVA